MGNKKLINILLNVLFIILICIIGYFALNIKERSRFYKNQNLPYDHVAVIENLVDTNQDISNLNNCFNEGSFTTNLNKSNWKTFEGFGFSVKYPTESIIITSIEDQYGEGKTGFEISSLTSSEKAYIRVYRLREETYRARYMHTPSVIYEPYSNTWWPEEYIWDPSKFKDCSPNSIGKTDDDKYPIYSTSDGDVGAFFVNYFVVLRDIVKTDNHEPIIVEFTIRGDRNDPNYSTTESFQIILENIIKSLELRPTSRG